LTRDLKLEGAADEALLMLRGWFDLTPRRRHYSYGMGSASYWAMGAAVTFAGSVAAFTLGDWWWGFGGVGASIWSARESLLLYRAGK